MECYVLAIIEHNKKGAFVSVEVYSKEDWAWQTAYEYCEYMWIDDLEYDFTDWREETPKDIIRYCSEKHNVEFCVAKRIIDKESGDVIN